MAVSMAAQLVEKWVETKVVSKAAHSVEGMAGERVVKTVVLMENKLENAKVELLAAWSVD